MIREFLLTILLAAIFTGLSYPVYQWLLGWFGGRKTLAALATLVLLLTLVLAPLLAVLGASANEALRVAESHPAARRATPESAGRVHQPALPSRRPVRRA